MVCEICGCIFYCERIVLDKKPIENKDGKNLIDVKEENNKIELVTLENNKEKNNDKKEISDKGKEKEKNTGEKTVVVGKNEINSDVKVILNNNEKEKKQGCCYFCCLSCHLCCRLCCESINNFCNNLILNAFSRKKLEKKNICCKSYEHNEKDFDKKKQCFCYCYQEKGFFYWVNHFMVNETQKEIFFCMILYLISRLSAIGCEYNYEIILQTVDIIDEMPVFLYSYLLCFIPITIFIALVDFFKKKFHEKKLDTLFEDDHPGDEEDSLFKYIFSTLVKFLMINNISLIALIIIFIFNFLFGLGQARDALFGGFENSEIFGMQNLMKKIIYIRLCSRMSILSFF